MICFNIWYTFHLTQTKVNNNDSTCQLLSSRSVGCFECNAEIVLNCFSAIS